MRDHPHDDDTLFQVAYELLGVVDNHPSGPRHAAGFAKNWLEACHMIRLKYGEDLAARVWVNRIYTIERLNDGRKIEHDHYNREPALLHVSAA